MCLLMVETISEVFLAAAQTPGRSALYPFQRAAWFQIDTDMAQVQNKRTDDSRFLMQRWQKYPFSQPPCCNLSLPQRWS